MPRKGTGQGLAFDLRIPVAPATRDRLYAAAKRADLAFSDWARAILERAAAEDDSALTLPAELAARVRGEASALGLDPIALVAIRLGSAPAKRRRAT